MTLFSPALAGPKLNLAGLAKLLKAKQMIPFGADLRLENLGLFLDFLAEKLTPKEKAALVERCGLGAREVELWQKLESRSKKLDRELKSAKLQKASRIYQALSHVPGDQVLFLLLRSPQRLVQDRIKNFLQKHLPAAHGGHRPRRDRRRSRARHAEVPESEGRADRHPPGCASPQSRTAAGARRTAASAPRPAAKVPGTGYVTSELRSQIASTASPGACAGSRT